MPAVHPCEVPADSLLRKYRDAPGFADCYVVEVQGRITQEAFVLAFYTSRLFKIERTILTWLAGRPASDADARQLAAGTVTGFSAWQVERQSASELLLADFTGRTRSWLRADAVRGSEAAPRTLLYFGSAVLPRAGRRSAKPSLGWAFHVLSGFHGRYSLLLLRAAGRACSR